MVQSPIMTKTRQELPSRILVVDDDPVLRAMLEASFQESSQEIIQADNGASALDILLDLQSRNALPDVVVTDIQMPRMGGLELLERMAERSIQVPAIAMTAVGDKEMVVKLLRLGVEEFVDKPFVMNDLQDRVAKILRRNRSRLGQAGLEIAFEGHRVRLDKDPNEARKILEKMRDRVDSISAADKGRIQLPAATEHLQLAWKMRETKEFGGQMVAHLSHPDRFELLIAQPNGHDASALQISSMIRLIFNASVTATTPCEEFLRVLGGILYQQPKQPLVRAMMLRIDYVRSTLEIACAGHPSPILVPHSGAASILATNTGNELGPFPAPQISCSTIPFSPFDRIIAPCPWMLLLSKTHAPTGAQLHLGAEGVAEFAQQCRNMPLPAMLDSIWERSMEFSHWNTAEDLLLIGIELRARGIGPS